MGSNGSAPGGRKQRHGLTATPSAAGRTPPSLHPVTSRLLDLYHECVDSGGWARLLYDVRGGMEKLIIFRKIPPPPPPTVADPPSCKPKKKDARQARGGVHETAGGARPGPRGGDTALSPPLTHRQQQKTPVPLPRSSLKPPQVESSPQAKSSPQVESLPQVEPLPAPSPPSAPPLRKRAKTHSEATHASSRASVLAKKQQIPQVDGCFLSPQTPPRISTMPSSLTTLTIDITPPQPATPPATADPSRAAPSAAVIPPAPPMSGRLPAHPEYVLCKDCCHNSHHIKFYHCSQCHLYPVQLYPRIKDPNGFYYD
jgi:hypothetical protein